MITTIKFKDIIKYLAITTGIIVIVVFVARYFLNKKEIGKNEKQDNLIKKHTLISCINISINSNEEITTEEDVKPTQEEQEKQEKIEVKDTYTNEYKGVKVKNLTDNIKLTESILKPDYAVRNKKNIIIYHTHTCESYTQTSKNTYKATGNYRTTDLNYSVVKVGDELAEELKKRGFNVVHNNTKHDYPAYTGSYSRSLETVEKLLKDNKNTDILIDLHRDAVDKHMVREVNGVQMAPIMFFNGLSRTKALGDISYLNNPNLTGNLAFSLQMQIAAAEYYPNLTRPIYLKGYRYNMHFKEKYLLIEMGSYTNTQEEARNAMVPLADLLNRVLHGEN